MCRVVTCGLPDSTIFSILSHKRQDFRKKVTEHDTLCFEFLYNLCLKHFSFFEELSEIRSKMCIGLYIKYPLFLSYFNEKFLDVFSKNTQNIKFHINLSSRNRIVTCGRTAAQTDMTKLKSLFAILRTRVKMGLSKLMHSNYRLERKLARIIKKQYFRVKKFQNARYKHGILDDAMA